MKKDEKIENENLEENQVLEPVEDKFLKHIPTKDNEILKKLDEVNQKLDSFEILEDDKEDDKKKSLGLALAFVALVVVGVGLFAFKKEVKNSNE